MRESKSKEPEHVGLSAGRIRLAEHLGIPKETVYGLSCVTMIGDRELYIENYLSILEYVQSRLCLRIKGGKLVITGSGLYILYFNDTDMQVRGCISAVTFEKGTDALV
jgi:sporulation protein YqfC